MSESSEKESSETERIGSPRSEAAAGPTPTVVEQAQATDCAPALVAEGASTNVVQSPEELKSNYLPEKSAIDYEHSYKMVVRRNYNHLFLSMGFWMVSIFLLIVSIGFFFLSHTVAGK